VGDIPQAPEELDQRGKYRRYRLMIWRAAALKMICDRDCFQDDIDRRQARDKLLESYQFFGPYNINGNTCNDDGSYGGCNFWVP
jgi:hypothetical protein